MNTFPPPSKIHSTRCEHCRGTSNHRGRKCESCNGRGYFIQDLSQHTKLIHVDTPKPVHDRTQIRLKLATLIRERKADSRCVKCGKPAEGSHCQPCKDKASALMHSRRLKGIA